MAPPRPASHRRFTSVDLPTLGLPMIATVGRACLATRLSLLGALDCAVLSVSCEARTRGTTRDGPLCLLMGA